uniref:Viral late gene transcription factor 3 zinc ribbon domain-containing protein n=1 Tax=Populus trichocarpa TaxID=3694 RepID=A0A3N7H8D2_POPTR
MEATAISSSLKLLITFPANKKALITTRKKRDTIQFSDQFPNSKSSTGHYPSPTGITINGRRLKTRFKISAINDYGISAAADIAQVEVTWQIIVGAIAGVTPFVVAGIEFSKRIIAQRRCQVCGGSGLVLRDKDYFRCPGCDKTFFLFSFLFTQLTNKICFSTFGRRVSTVADMEKILLWLVCVFRYSYVFSYLYTRGEVYFYICDIFSRKLFRLFFSLSQSEFDGVILWNAGIMNYINGK